MADKQKIKYKMGFEIPIGPDEVELLVNYFSRKGYKASFSYSEDNRSGTLSLDKKLKKEYYDAIAGSPMHL